MLLLFSRFLRAVADAVHSLGDLAGADLLEVALGVRTFRALQSSGLRGKQGEQGKNVNAGTEIPLGTKTKNGNAVCVTTQSPKRPTEVVETLKWLNTDTKLERPKFACLGVLQCNAS